MNIIDDPGQDRLINELYAWVSIDPKTLLEGLCGVNAPGGLTLQAVTSSQEKADQMKPFIQEMAKYTDKKFKLIRFSLAEIVETIN